MNTDLTVVPPAVVLQDADEDTRAPQKITVRRPRPEFSMLRLQDMLDMTFPTHRILHMYSSNHVLLKIKLRDMIDGLRDEHVVNWALNRNPCPIRCREIAKYVYDTKTIDYDWQFCAAYIDGKYCIYDGMHRLCALLLLSDENIKPLTVGESQPFGHDGSAVYGWLLDKDVMVNVHYHISPKALVQRFNILNKSVSVPNLYLSGGVSTHKKEIVESIVNKFGCMYSAHFSANAKPNIPNITRDCFIGVVETIYDVFNITRKTYPNIELILAHLNTKIANSHLDLKPAVMTKCVKTGCYLFIYKEQVLEKMIKDIYDIYVLTDDYTAYTVANGNIMPVPCL